MSFEAGQRRSGGSMFELRSHTVQCIAQRPMDARPSLYLCFLMLANRMTNLTARISAISAERELTISEIVHAKMEKRHVALPTVYFHLCIHAKVHVPVRCRIIVSDVQPSMGWKELREVRWPRWDSRRLISLSCILGWIILRNIIFQLILAADSRSNVLIITIPVLFDRSWT